MIYFVAPRRDANFVEVLETKTDRRLSGLVGVITYDELIKRKSLPLATYVFTAMGIMTAVERRVAASVWDSLAAADEGPLLLNHPLEVLGRFDLFQEMRARGINDFRAHRVSELDDFSTLRYPVFVREERRHSGPLSVLLANEAELELGLRDVTGRGFPAENLLIVEFCDTGDADGVFRKFAAFKVGDRVFPKSVDYGYRWALKYENADYGVTPRGEPDEDKIAEEYRFMTENPHEEWIRGVFAVANIDYGRIDYGIQGDELRVWEINTAPSFYVPLNPHRTALEERLHRLRRPVGETFYRDFFPALEALDVHAGASAEIPIAVAKSLHRPFKKALAVTATHDRLNKLLPYLWKLPGGPLRRRAVRLVEGMMYRRR